MVKHPDFKLLVNNENVTDRLKKYIFELTVTDNDKDTADELSITLSKKFKRPEFGSQLRVYLGFKEDAKLQFVGLFHLSSSTLTDNKSIALNATAVDYQKSLKERKWESVTLTLEQLVKSIADKHGLSCRVNITNDKAQLFEQNNESDLAFLNRLAKKYNATFNVKNNTVYFVQGKESKPSVSIALDSCHTSSITESAPTLYLSGKGRYQDTKTNKQVIATVGSGEPCLSVQGKWHTLADAEEDITNALKRANLAEKSGTLSKEWELVFSGSEAVIDGEQFSVKRVTHKYTTSSLTVDLEFNNDLKEV